MTAHVSLALAWDGIRAVERRRELSRIPVTAGETALFNPTEQHMRGKLSLLGIGLTMSLLSQAATAQPPPGNPTTVIGGVSYSSVYGHLGLNYPADAVGIIRVDSVSVSEGGLERFSVYGSYSNPNAGGGWQQEFRATVTVYYDGEDETATATETAAGGVWEVGWFPRQGVTGLWPSDVSVSVTQKFQTAPGVYEWREIAFSWAWFAYTN